IRDVQNAATTPASLTTSPADAPVTAARITELQPNTGTITIPLTIRGTLPTAAATFEATLASSQIGVITAGAPTAGAKDTWQWEVFDTCANTSTPGAAKDTAVEFTYPTAGTACANAADERDRFQIRIHPPRTASGIFTDASTLIEQITLKIAPKSGTAATSYVPPATLTLTFAEDLKLTIGDVLNAAATPASLKTSPDGEAVTTAIITEGDPDTGTITIPLAINQAPGGVIGFRATLASEPPGLVSSGAPTSGDKDTWQWEILDSCARTDASIPGTESVAFTPFSYDAPAGSCYTELDRFQIRIHPPRTSDAFEDENKRIESLTLTISISNITNLEESSKYALPAKLTLTFAEPLVTAGSEGTLSITAVRDSRLNPIHTAPANSSDPIIASTVTEDASDTTLILVYLAASSAPAPTLGSDATFTATLTGIDFTAGERSGTPNTWHWAIRDTCGGGLTETYKAADSNSLDFTYPTTGNCATDLDRFQIAIHPPFQADRTGRFKDANTKDEVLTIFLSPKAGTEAIEYGIKPTRHTITFPDNDN
ncbi:MAG: hypothetical protein GDA55_01150, partial [Cellvibrionales bacterium]|nr:hypothetical protein [Cellvibrionales bacterium]